MHAWCCGVHELNPVLTTRRAEKDHPLSLCYYVQHIAACLVSKICCFRVLEHLFWQILSNHGVTKLKRFISRFTVKLCN